MALLDGKIKELYQKILIKEKGFPLMADGSFPGLNFFNSLPKTKVLYDQFGIPSVYYCYSKFNWDPTNGFNSSQAHPAFIWDGVEHSEVWISNFPNVVIDKTTGEIVDTSAGYSDNSNYVAASLPYQDPATYINFNNAVDLCDRKNSAAMRAAGNCFHLTTNAEWAAIAIWRYQMIKDGLFSGYPYGNTNYGRDVNAKGVTGSPLNPTLTLGSNGGTYGAPFYGRWRNGSGGPLTAHNSEVDGIYDLIGNIWEWVSGLQSPSANNGKDAYIIPNNEAAIATPAQLKDIATAPGAPWEKIGEWNSLNDEYFSKENRTNFLTAGTYSLDDAEKLSLIANSDVPEDFGNDYFYKPDVGEENVPLRGGAWSGGSNAGLFSLNLGSEAPYAYIGLGFRSAYVGDINAVT
jgi:hypothetical protein